MILMRSQLFHLNKCLNSYRILKKKFTKICFYELRGNSLFLILFLFESQTGFQVPLKMVLFFHHSSYMVSSCKKTFFFLKEIFVMKQQKSDWASKNFCQVVFVMILELRNENIYIKNIFFKTSTYKSQHFFWGNVLKNISYLHTTIS